VAVYKLNEASVCRFYAELLLRTASKVTFVSTISALNHLYNVYVSLNIDFFSLLTYCVTNRAVRIND